MLKDGKQYWIIPGRSRLSQECHYLWRISGVNLPGRDAYLLVLSNLENGKNSFKTITSSLMYPSPTNRKIQNFNSPKIQIEVDGFSMQIEINVHFITHVL